MGWEIWLALIVVLTILEFVVAEVIPFFDGLLSTISSLFVSGFTFYFPAIMWFMFVHEGSYFDKKNVLLTVINSIILSIGMIVLVARIYSIIVDMVSFSKAHSCFIICKF